ncbi:MAG TPA: ABC transporter ATP-binding protein [bacterium]|nr:ABC transporter ATP-binding protein [bacterium]
MTDAITIKNISKIYRVPSIIPWRRPRVVEALQDVSFSCPKNQISCLLGPNGAGKTTIIKILAGLVLPDAGDAIILGIHFSKVTNRFRTKIGLATSNERSFYWRLTGYQNLDFYAALYGFSRREKRDRVFELLSEVDLVEQADKPFRQYSAGMKQKLILARALLGNPEILLLDEPTVHLDPLAQRVIHKLIRERFVEKRKTTVLFCTHDLTEAQELADNLIFLNDGKIYAEGSLSSLRSDLHSRPRLILEFARLPQTGWEKGLPVILRGQEKERLEVEVLEPSDIPSIIEAAVSANGRLISCHSYKESLSELFTRFTGKQTS